MRDPDALMLQCEAEAASLEARLALGFGFGTPGAIQGERVFVPEQSSFLLNSQGRSGYPAGLVNYVVRDEEHELLIRAPGPGVFEAHGIHVAVFKKMLLPSAVVPTDDPPTFTTGNQFSWVNATPISNMNFTDPTDSEVRRTFYSSTRKFSLFPFNETVVKDQFDSFASLPSYYSQINYLWNVLDPRSQRKLSDDWLNQILLSPRMAEVEAFDPTNVGSPPSRLGQPQPPSLMTFSEGSLDGGIHWFPSPWTFGRDAEIIFQWRPITPVLQWDSSIALPGWPWDDRIGGRRDQSVKLVVTLLGMRMEPEA